MKVVIARTMPEFSMDVYADGVIAGLRAVRPKWDIVEIAPYPFDRTNRSLWTRLQKNYERFWRYPQAVRRQKADLFHIIDHSEAHLAYWLQKAGKPVIVTCHDLINLIYPQNLKGTVRIPFVSHAAWEFSIQGMQKSEHIITVSQVTAKDVTNVLGIDSNHITVIPNAVEASFHPLPAPESASWRQQQQLSPEVTCLLNVGSNHPRKNIATILQVVRSLKEQRPIHLWKVGADFTTEQKALIQTCGLENHITYLGQPDKQTLVKIYNAADLLLAPSIHEGFGMTILEAMACGTPVITSTTSALPEVAGGAAALIEPTNVLAIVEAIVQVQTNSAYREELIQKGLARVKAFTWEAIGEQIAQLYEQSLSQQKTVDSLKPYSKAIHV